VKHTQINFKQEMGTYLDMDVQIVYDIIARMGPNLADEYGIDIGKKMTVGSHAMHIWKHTLEQDIPKLSTKEQADRWNECNRGGFCSPMGNLHYECQNDEIILPFDITSLYPASMRPIEYKTATGIKEPIKDWYQGFPDIRQGLKLHHFSGGQMNDEQFHSLKK